MVMDVGNMWRFHSRFLQQHQTTVDIPVQDQQPAKGVGDFGSLGGQLMGPLGIPDTLRIASFLIKPSDIIQGSYILRIMLQ